MNTMILFRADANSNIGSGHVMRCLSIAQALRERGAECVFVSADDGAKALTEASAFPCHILCSNHLNLEEELPAFTGVLKKLRPDFIVVDSYSVTEAYVLTLGKYAYVAYIDDLAERTLPVSLIINYNISANAKQYQQLYPQSVQRLLGVTYAPLRDEFRNVSYQSRDCCEDLFLSTGGADPMHIGVLLLKAILRDPRISWLRQHIIIGAFHPDTIAIEKMAAEHPSIVLHQRVVRMAELMCACDLAVSAAGSTLYELCACGIPSVCYTFVDNQTQIARGFSDAGLIELAGDFRNDSLKTVESIVNRIVSLCQDSDRRQQTSARMRHTVDAKGAWRIADALLRFRPLV